MSSVFHLIENVRQLKNTVGRYFTQRLGVFGELPDYDPLLQSVMMSVIQEVRQRKCRDDLESMNRRVLVLLIPRLIEQMPASSAPVVPAVPAVPAVPESSSYGAYGGAYGGDAYADVGADADDMQTMPSMEKNKDRMFMEKLEELEQSRRLPLEKLTAGTGVGAGAGASLNPPLSTMDVLVPHTPVGSANTTGTATIQTLFIPSPERKGNPIWIQSWQRNWIQYPQRNGFSWSGGIPQGIDLTQSKVVCVLLPMVWMKRISSPYVVLQIEGVGGGVVQLFLNHTGTCADANEGWGKYVPISPDLSFMRTMACPWTINLLTASGKQIPLGYDGQTVVWRNGAHFTIQNDTSGLSVGDDCWVFGEGGKTAHWTVQEDLGGNDGNNTRTYVGQWNDGSKPLQEGQLLNFSQQWCVLMDVVKKSA